jgi:ribonuclease BN (tRNA processing enzyme)
MTHLFVSHSHVDHAGELAALFFAFRYGMSSRRDAPITVIGPPELERVMGGLSLAFGPKLFDPKFPVNVRFVTPGESLSLGAGSTLEVTRAPHTAESLAVRFRSGRRTVGYTGDTEYSEELTRFFSGADLLISECSFREPREGVRHLTISEAGRMAAQARVSRLVVTHFYFDFDEAGLKAELGQDFAGEVIVGCDGLSIEIEE